MNSREDYVRLYAESLKNSPQLFADHKMFINAQLRGSRDVFAHFGTGVTFKKNAREYLRGIQKL